ncbi:hypothetical protein IFM89_009946 [Coptis chinensis]|uniref:SHSP domain-containing protein n=1 Tax=Coptis chinensis TaxID=261450 RepID=A0A835HLF7_9MAGN|nr:hypothetical protein IFM89_009946 [Coptis chinensis]
MIINLCAYNSLLVTGTDRGVSLPTEGHKEVDEVAAKLQKYCVDKPVECPLIFGEWDVVYCSVPTLPGGSYRSALGRMVFKTKEMVQVVEAPDVVKNKVSFSAFGFLDGEVSLKGKLKVLDDKWIQVIFEPPELKVGALEFQYGGESEVKLEITYIDEKIRLGRVPEVHCLCSKDADEPCSVSQHTGSEKELGTELTFANYCARAKERRTAARILSDLVKLGLRLGNGDLMELRRIRHVVKPVGFEVAVSRGDKQEEIDIREMNTSMHDRIAEIVAAMTARCKDCILKAVYHCTYRIKMDMGASVKITGNLGLMTLPLLFSSTANLYQNMQCKLKCVVNPHFFTLKLILKKMASSILLGKMPSGSNILKKNLGSLAVALSPKSAARKTLKKMPTTGLGALNPLPSAALSPVSGRKLRFFTNNAAVRDYDVLLDNYILDTDDEDEEYHVLYQSPTTFSVGIGKEDVKVSVEDDILSIKGEEPKEAEGDNVRAANIYSLKFVTPSELYKVYQIKAEMKNGVLMVIVPKVKYEETRKNVVQVNVV